MSLSIQRCAEQFDLYAEANENATKIGVNHGVASERIQLNEWRKERAFAYRHAAKFLREWAVLQWTSEPPTEPGTYWMRRPDGATITSLVAIENGIPLVALDDVRIPIPPDYQVAGPLPEPIEALPTS